MIISKARHKGLYRCIIINKDDNMILSLYNYSRIILHFFCNAGTLRPVPTWVLTKILIAACKLQTLESFTLAIAIARVPIDQLSAISIRFFVEKKSSNSWCIKRWTLIEADFVLHKPTYMSERSNKVLFVQSYLMFKNKYLSLNVL